MITRPDKKRQRRCKVEVNIRFGSVGEHRGLILCVINVFEKVGIMAGVITPFSGSVGGAGGGRQSGAVCWPD